MRATRFARAAAAIAFGTAGVALGASCDVELGTMPSKCIEGQCPDGYACIHEVCALPDTKVPTTVERLSYLRGGDLELVPQSGSVLVVWETYAYSEELQGFFARRIGPDGEPSARLELDRTFEADEGGLEPYFDVLATSDTSAVLAVTAGPVDDDVRPRIAIYAVTLPAQGDEASGATSQRVGEEIRVQTIGYGAVSRPHLVQLGADALQLGYVVSRSKTGQTEGVLGVLDLDSGGATTGALPTCFRDPVPMVDTCPLVRSADDLPVAVGVVDAFVSGTTTDWVLDDARPSVATTDAMGEPIELRLPPLAIPLRADASGVDYLVPSARAGDQLPSDPVEGPAALGSIGRTATAQPQPGPSLPVIRDTPRPAWVPVGSDGQGVLVTPGANVDAATLSVLRVDLGTGDVSTVQTIERFSSLELASVKAAVVDGHLYVVWLESGDDQAVIRAVVLDAP